LAPHRRPPGLRFGHRPTDEHGNLARPLGKVGAEATEEQACAAARLTGLAMLGSLKRELGSTAWPAGHGFSGWSPERRVSRDNPLSSTVSPI
jgi:hypothetical protein